MNTLTPILAIGSFSTTEMMIVAVLVLVLFGAKKLPTFARSLGRSMGEFKRAKEDFERELHAAADEEASNAQQPVKPQPAVKTISVDRERDHQEA